MIDLENITTWPFNAGSASSNPGIGKNLKSRLITVELLSNVNLQGILIDPTSLYNLATLLRKRYKRWGRIEDLEETIGLERAYLELLPEGHPDGSIAPTNLAISEFTRFEEFGRTEYLQEAIKLLQVALKLCPDGLVTSLYARYEHHRRSEDLEAIGLERAALELCPEGHPDRSASLSSLATSLYTRFEQHGRSEDIEEAVELVRAALVLRTEGHPNQSTSLRNLATYLCTRYKQYEKSKDLEEAVELDTAALELRPEGHPIVICLLATLQTPCTHPNWHFFLGSLTVPLLTRFEQYRSTKDLEEAIKSERAALKRHPNSHPDCSEAGITGTDDGLAFEV